MRPARPARRLVVLFGLGGLLALARPGAAGDETPSAPLPELRGFLADVRDRLHTDDYLIDQYTFTERQTQRRMDGKGSVKKVTSALYEVYPSPEPGHTYRKLIARDGKPLTTEELADEDRKQQKKEEKFSAALTKPDDPDRAAAKAERRLKEKETIEELFRVYDIAIVGREPVEGRSTIVLTFGPRAGVEASTKAGRILRKFEGRAWIDEEDRQLVRVEARLIDDLSFGWGILARLKKGARAEMQRRKINGEIWLPSEARFIGQARLLLVKGLNIDALSEYSDYRKFHVATEASVKPDPQR
jgi:hypothetical protein